VDNVYDWSASAAHALGLPVWAGEPAAVRAVLDLARVTAHDIARPAAPVGAFLVGMAVGLAGASTPADFEQARDALVATLPSAGGDSDSGGE
jgi:hypothetical protein